MRDGMSIKVHAMEAPLGDIHHSAQGLLTEHDQMSTGVQGSYAASRNPENDLGKIAEEHHTANFCFKLI